MSLAKRNSRGQSTIEFIFSFFFVLIFVFLFIRTAMNFTAGYLVHYATFMASRAYLTFDDGSNSEETSDGNAAEHAQKVFESYKTDLFLNIAKGPTFGVNAPDKTREIYIGNFVDYEQKFGMTMLGTGDMLKFRSESFLGREPTKQECVNQVCNALVQNVGIPGCNDDNITLYDNGC